MLHILLLILKIIGIILAAILGILVLLLCIVLFTPLKYKGAASFGGTIDTAAGELKMTWLFHLVEVRVNFKERKAAYYIRIAWKKIKGQEEGAGHAAPEDPETEELLIKGEGEDENEITKLEEKQEKTVESGGQECEGAAPEDEKESGLPERTETEHKKTAETAEEEETCSEEKPSKLQSIIQKWKTSVEKIKCTFTRICDKIKELSEKKEKVLDFIQEEAHKNAFMKGKTEVFRLIKKLRPKKLKADVRFGLEDPYRTGQVLAVFGVLYPFIGEHVRIRPDFEQRVLDGEFLIQGRIRACYFAVLALRLIISGAVRTTIKDVKNFE